MTVLNSWESIAAAKRGRLLASIPPEWLIPQDLFPSTSQTDVTGLPSDSASWFSPAELEITAASASHIVQQTTAGAWSAESVARAFCKRAAVAHQLVNCLAETLFPEAIDRAKSLDAHFQATGKPLGPLHGLPVSIKDSFNLVGRDSAIGFTAWIDQPASYDSVLPQVLRAAGAVLYVKTATPTSMMIAETVNNIYGRSSNPRNRHLTSGGSSGGESALVTFRGSPLGVGSDIGGSLRIPAALTGNFTLRPSFGRFPNSKTKSGLAGQESVMAVNGPMAPDLASLELFASAITSTQPWLHDPKCIPVPWRPVETKQKLKLAVMWNDGMVRPTPPVRRALRETVAKLKHAGHEIVEWEPVGHDVGVQLSESFFLSDGGKSVAKALAPYDEPIRPEMERYTRAVDAGVHGLWQLHLRRNELQCEYLERWNACGDLDGLLTPTCPFAAVEHSKYRHVGYTCVFNILDYTCLSFPCAVAADQAVDQLDAEDEKHPLSETDELVRNEYNPAAIHGMPVSLQLVGRRLEEEKVLMMGRVVRGTLEK